MTVQLHIAGPGLDVVWKLEPGEPELVLGRDADCAVRLPDPQRNVSRHHLALWLDEGELKFRVLSVVNGVDMPFGEVPPGAQGVLPLGQTLKVGDYSVVADALPEFAPPPAVADPWEPSTVHGVANAPAAAPLPLPRPASADALSPSEDDDPFGDWGFQSTFGRGMLVAPPLDSDSQIPGPVPAFFRGLGLDPAAIGTLSDGELEAIGRVVRVLTLGVLELDASASLAKQDMRAEDRTMIAAKDPNPLKNAWPEDTKLRYIFGGRAAAAGLESPERAMGELVSDLIAHNSASGAAVRRVLESTIKEFAPAALKTRLLGQGTKLFQNARVWSAYCKYYEQEAQDLGRWTQRLVDRYFAEAYLRESARMKRDTPTRPR